GLINALYSLKAQYHNRVSWIFHRDAIKMLRKIKDGDGQYVWQQSVQAGQPDLILSKPYKMSEYCPNTFTTGLYVGIVGDYKHYWIADALDMRVQRLNELYAATNQIGFIGRLESDGMPVLEEGFARIKLA
ncbi:MAG: phage major capsid protein, partial [Pseudomonadota bacterium]